MAERPSVYTIPAHRAFADALVGGLMRGRDQAALARGLVLLPNNRAKRAIQDAFVRASEGGLLLPRLVAVGDPELDEAVFDAAGDEAPVPPPPVLIAEVGGEPRATRSLATGHVVADHFVGTEELVELLALRAEQLRTAIAAPDATGRAIGPSEAPA